MPSRYINTPALDLERVVTDDLKAALGKRGPTVTHDGKPGRPDIVVDCGGFAVVVEVALRSGAAAAAEYLAIRDHRDLVESELGKRTHLLFTCIRTPDRIVRAMREENAAREKAETPGRVLFLDLSSLELILQRLAETSAELYPIDRWDAWFVAWEASGDDVVALEQMQRIVFAEDEKLRDVVAPMVHRRVQAEQEALRKDIRRLEDVLRLSNVTGHAAMRVLVYVVFVKLYEEKREAEGRGPSRFTSDGFAAYRKGMPAKAQQANAGRTLQYLIDNEIAADAEVQEAGLLAGVILPPQVTDALVEQKFLKVLDKYRFRGTHLDALGAVFEAIARRAEKDTRIGQFFTPEPIVRFAVDIARPEPTELVLDPAAGTGRFLVTAMERMLANAGSVPGVAQADAISAIQRRLLLGTDTDEWIVTIAKMNMYIHGDGKSGIHQENGLFLADLPVFGDAAGKQLPKGPPPRLLGEVDVCLTNPPLGAMSYRTYAEDLLRRHGVTYKTTSDWLHDRLPILPGDYRERGRVRDIESQVEKWKNAEREAILAGDAKAEAKASRYRKAAEDRRAKALAHLHAGTGTFVVSGSTAKGGALFLAAIKDYLRPVHDPGAPEEWRGGRVAIVVDEAILNTPEYGRARAFIRQHYFIKAIFSFHRNAFWYQARTTAKTSLLYLYRKPDPTVKQREPIFFGHVDRIGFTRTGKPDETELPRMLEAYLAHEAVLRASYKGAWFDEATARDSVGALSLPPLARMQWQGGLALDATSRLDYAAEAARQLREKLPAEHRPLSYYAEVVTRTPPEDPLSLYQFATVDRTTGEVRPWRMDTTEYDVGDLRVIGDGDIVVSGMDLVNGSVGYARANVAGQVVSKEFYTLRIRPEREAELDARYLALLLRTPYARELVAGTVTGTSNRTRIEDEASLLAIPLPPLPDISVQNELARRVERALERRRRARVALSESLGAANKAWEGPSVPPATSGAGKISAENGGHGGS